jgi:membrane protease YdiL (CAAX protease family)
MAKFNDSHSKEMKPARVLSPGLLLALFLFTYNNVVNFLPPTLHAPLYVWMNLGVLLLVWIWSRHHLNLTLSDIGCTRHNIGKSILYGLILSAVVIIPFVILLWLLPGLGFSVKTPRLETIAKDIFWWRIFIRIPIGTAFFEEMLFRGIFYGYLAKKLSQARTVFITSLFFGFWHIMPAFRVVSRDLQIAAPFPFVALWLLLILGSIVGGILFAWTRYRSRNITGCVLAHALINVLSLVGASVVWQ